MRPDPLFECAAKHRGHPNRVIAILWLVEQGVLDAETAEGLLWWNYRLDEKGNPEYWIPNGKTVTKTLMNIRKEIHQLLHEKNTEFLLRLSTRLLEDIKDAVAKTEIPTKQIQGERPDDRGQAGTSPE
jgi:hypothetical protein